jgi:tRNA(Ile)-lysidine synthase
MQDGKPLEPKYPPLEKGGGGDFWLAYSGGLDSHVLLHLFGPKEPGFFKAIHIHHNLSPNADAWEAHCRKTCEELGVEYHCIYVNAHPKPGESPEAAARTARYEALATLIGPEDSLFTAHHLEDQAETLLLQLFRGAGVKGLAAMPHSMPFAQGTLFRPLLTWSKQLFLDYAKEHHLHWIEDESNSNTDFDRNYIRHHVLPVIRDRWPAITPVLGRVANHCAEANEILDKAAQRDFTVSIKQLTSLSYAEQNNVLRYWLRSQNFPVPSTTQLTEFQLNILHSKPDANPIIHLTGVNIRRYRDTLYALPDTPKWEPPAAPINWNLQESLTLPDGRKLSAAIKIGLGIRVVSGSIFQVRFRQNGERCHPAGRQGSHPLKKLFQEWGIPPWERDAIPLLYLDDQLVCVVGYCVSASFAADSEEEGWILKVSI